MQIHTWQDKLQQIESIKWDVCAQALMDYEQMWLQSTVLWNDASLSADAFDTTYAAYIHKNMEGEKVAHEFFVTYEMILRESR